VLRREIMEANGWSLRELYRVLETPGANRLCDAHAALDIAAHTDYGMSARDDILAFLLNLARATKEENYRCCPNQERGGKKPGATGNTTMNFDWTHNPGDPSPHAAPDFLSEQLFPMSFRKYQST